MNGSVVISDTFLKSAVNASIYTCLKTGSVAVETTCYESIDLNKAMALRYARG